LVRDSENNGVVFIAAKWIVATYDDDDALFTLLTDMIFKKDFIEDASRSRKSFMNSMKFSFP